MNKVRDALVEVVIIILVGGLIGAVLAVVSNLFVIGVQWFGQQREASDMLSLSIGGDTVSFSSVVFLWAAAAVVVFLKTSLGISRWTLPQPVAAVPSASTGRLCTLAPLWVSGSNALSPAVCPTKSISAAVLPRRFQQALTPPLLGLFLRMRQSLGTSL